MFVLHYQIKQELTQQQMYHRRILILMIMVLLHLFKVYQDVNPESIPYSSRELTYSKMDVSYQCLFLIDLNGLLSIDLVWGGI